MSEKKQPTAEDFAEAVAYLFAFKTLATKHKIDISEEDIRAYGAIGAFLSDAGLVKAALLKVAAEMARLLESDPARFTHGDESAFVTRSTAKRQEFETATFTAPEGLKGKPLADARQLHERTEKAKSVAGKLFGEMQDGLKALAKDEKLMGGLCERGGVMVRRFRFRPLLQALEAGMFVDLGAVLSTNEPINPKLWAAEVWKDSIAFEHGEYTHRLQWLAIAAHFKDWPKATITRLYKGCAATLKATVRTAFGCGDSVPDPNAQLALPDTLWTFLFDCRQPRSPATSCWPAVTGPVTPSAPHERYRHAARSDTCRTPIVFTRMLMADASLGLIHAYLAASNIKLIRVLAGAAPEQSLSKYRQARQAAKTPVVAVFDTPHATTIATTTGVNPSKLEEGM